MNAKQWNQRRVAITAGGRSTRMSISSQRRAKKMWRSLVFLAVVAVSYADEEQRIAGLRGAIEPRLGASALRIGRLSKEIEQMHGALNKASKIDPRGFLNEMHARLHEVEENRHHSCPNRRQARCGYSVECISLLFMCDGKKDCHNGWDEEDSTCRAGPVVAGNVFSGTAHWFSCRTFKDHPVSLRIVAVLRPKIVGSHRVVRGVVSADVEGDGGEKRHIQFGVKGYYVSSIHRLAFKPVDPNGPLGTKAFVCRWNRGDDDRVTCKIGYEASLHECATAHLTLEHHADEH